MSRGEAIPRRASGWVAILPLGLPLVGALIAWFPGAPFALGAWLALWAGVGVLAGALAWMTLRWPPLRQRLPSWSAAAFVATLFAGATVYWAVTALGRLSEEEPLAPWREFVAPDKSFRVEMPGKPRSKKERLPGQRVTATTYYIERSRRSGHVLSYFTIPREDEEHLTVADRFEGALQGILKKSPGARILSDGPIEVEDAPGRQFEVEIPNQVQIVVRLLAVNRRFYMFMVFDPQCRAHMPKVRRFLDSFQAVRPPAPLPPAAAADNFDGLTAYWDFDAWGKKDKAPDLSPNKLHATLRNVAPADGIRAKGARFNGTSSVMDLGPSPRLNVNEGAGFAVAAWFKPDGDQEGTLLSFRNRDPKNPVGIVVKAGARNLWAEVHWSDRKLGVRSTKLQVTDRQLKNRWTHFVLMRPGAGSLALYVDGVEIPHERGDLCSGSIVTDVRRIGEGFQGTLDEVSVFNQALRERDLQALAGKIPGWVDSPLRGPWRR